MAMPRARSRLASRTKSPADGNAQMIGALMLQPDVAGVIIGELDVQQALVCGQRGSDLFDECFLSLNIDGGEQLVLVNRLQQLLVLVLALLFGVRERWNMTELRIELEFGSAAVSELEELFGGRHGASCYAAIGTGPAGRRIRTRMLRCCGQRRECSGIHSAPRPWARTMPETGANRENPSFSPARGLLGSVVPGKVVRRQTEGIDGDDNSSPGGTGPRRVHRDAGTSAHS